MAEYNITPFGSDATMPAGYPIADNLRTNSAQQALSARQGKNLGDFLFDTEEVVDTSGVTQQTGWITMYGTDAWANKWITNSDYGYKLVPVTEGKYRVTAKDNKNAYFTVLASATGAGQQQVTPDFATGYDRLLIVDAGETSEIIVPSDGVYLYIGAYANGADITPVIHEITHEAGIVEKITEIAGEQNLPQAKAYIVVAASDAPKWQKVGADYQCDGVNDELTIQAAIDSLPAAGGRIRLTSGIFIIDSFPNDRSAASGAVYTDHEAGDSHRYAAIMLPQDGKHIIIEGDTFRTWTTPCTTFRVSDACYNSLGANDLRVVIASAFPPGAVQINNKNQLTLTNLHIELPWNQKPIMCIDMLFTGRVTLQNINCNAYINGSGPAEWYVDFTSPVPIAVPHCVGLRSTGGSNMGLCNDYRNLNMSGFYEGYKFSGEHVLGVHCGALMCYYGFTFGNFTFTNASMHPMAFINCGNERCVNGPYFANCSSCQQIDLLQWTQETGNSYIPGGQGRGLAATEKVPGTFRGRIDYLITRGDSESTPSVPWVNDVAAPFWEDGHGHGFISRNMAHLPACATNVRNTYKPDYLEHIWDTTLGKEVICTNEATKEWRDAMGNIV